eukprot:CAMPEP_0172530490 /NCGR_PEP_ID=MMETSP1067-20121228/4211_1 /TAXON_ID=265564 ORGANISM="Thalassiosira punctigera, Strain Tpunct2005C2" /NCGR_SAMPLE_ID=MMETSP1067 /ASSEMBLY_ACC=CAM_ASM_000444 /LENGTH=276 /DNA_ID=CAMNT_0013314709 /DNA_START=128 /DNA_END=958 /DNA_ORIENTATION=-
MRSTTVCCLLSAVSGALAFTAPPSLTTRTRTAVRSTVESPAASAEAAPSTPSPPEAPKLSEKNKPTWEVKQHLYGLDMVKEGESSNVASVTLDAEGNVADGGGGAALPLPQTYITCGKCKSLFAISAEDLGDKGKGCRVKCSVCNNSWFQSRDRLFDIPTDTHDMTPADSSELDRIARNLARDIPPNFMGVSKLYVGNLDWTTTSEELLQFFQRNAKNEAGEDVAVCDASIVMGPNGRSRGFAFVSFYDEKDGKAALECNGLECNGRELAVREPNN